MESELTFKPGEKVVCIHAGHTPLREGAVYTVHSVDGRFMRLEEDADDKYRLGGPPEWSTLRFRRAEASDGI